MSFYEKRVRHIRKHEETPSGKTGLSVPLKLVGFRRSSPLQFPRRVVITNDHPYFVCHIKEREVVTKPVKLSKVGIENNYRVLSSYLYRFLLLCVYKTSTMLAVRNLPFPVHQDNKRDRY